MSIQVPKHVRAGLVVLSPTRVNQGIRCLRKHTLSDTLSYLPSGVDESAALTFGTHMHSAAALMWASDGDASVGTEYLRAQVWPTDNKHNLELAMQCWGAYGLTAKAFPFSLGGDDDKLWEFVAIEERVQLHVRQGVTLSFQLDRLMRNTSTGQLALIDLKTAARCDSRWRKQWRRDLQMKLYSEAVHRQYGQELSWLIIEGLDKSNATLTYEVLPEFSEEVRAEAWRDFEWVAQHNEMLLAAATRPDGTLDTEHLAVLALTETPHSPAECFTYGSECPFLPLCDAEPSERIALLREGYTYHEPDYV